MTNFVLHVANLTTLLKSTKHMGVSFFVSQKYVSSITGIQISNVNVHMSLLLCVNSVVCCVVTPCHEMLEKCTQRLQKCEKISTNCDAFVKCCSVEY